MNNKDDKKPTDSASDIELIDNGKVVDDDAVVNEYTMVIYPEELKKAKIKPLSNIKLNKEVAEDIKRVVREEFNNVNNNINYSLKKVENIKFSSAKIDMLKPPKKYKKMFKVKNALRSIIAISCLVIAGFVLNIIYNYYQDQKQALLEAQELKKLEYSEVSNISLTLNKEAQNEINDTKNKRSSLSQNESINYYLSKNSDTIGYLEVKNTDISYPIVQGSDNKYYLNNSFYKQRNTAGWLFADYRNSFPDLSKNTIIYGHNLNSAGVMFGTLKKVLTDEWLGNTDNYIIRFDTITKEYNWQVFSIYITNPDFNYIDVNFSDDEFMSFVQKVKGMSIRYFDVSIGKDDKILTLSTCSGSNKRLVVQAKLIKE